MADAEGRTNPDFTHRGAVGTFRDARGASATSPKAIVAHGRLFPKGFVSPHGVREGARRAEGPDFRRGGSSPGVAEGLRAVAEGLQGAAEGFGGRLQGVGSDATVLPSIDLDAVRAALRPITGIAEVRLVGGDLWILVEDVDVPREYRISHALGDLVDDDQLVPRRLRR